eukprot:COSAG02_NODE_13979_length_1324_cov_3.539592_1_plen_126_part_10
MNGDDEPFFYEKADGTNEETTVGKVQALADAGELELVTRVWTACLGESWMTLDEAIATGNVVVDCPQLVGDDSAIAAEEKPVYYESPDGENVEAKLRDVQALIASGVLKPDTNIWTESLGEEWMTL